MTVHKTVCVNCFCKYSKLFRN